MWWNDVMTVDDMIKMNIVRCVRANVFPTYVNFCDHAIYEFYTWLQKNQKCTNEIQNNIPKHQ